MAAARNAIEATKAAGPEDAFVVQTVSDGASWRSGPRSSVVPTAAATPADQAHFSTLSRFLTTEPYKSIMEGLAQSRHLCSQERLSVSLCQAEKPSHLKASHCTEKLFDHKRCMMKLARFTQRECSSELRGLAGCMRLHGGSATDPRAVSACADRFLAFDMCTEEF